MIFDKKAKWSFEEGVKPSWGHHKIPLHEPYDFVCARGGARTGEKKIYDFKRTPEYMQFLRDQGDTQVWFNWWKGSGRKHEAKYQADVIRLMPVCKDLCLRVILYVSLGSLTLDTLLLEEPNADTWVAKTQAGFGASCQVSHQCFRRRPCYTSEEYLSYMEQMLIEGMKLGADGIHFDNIGMQAEPESCHCDRCLTRFREYLQLEYGNEKGLEIFGWNDFSKTGLPWFNQHNTANKLFELKAPIQRAWVDFKVKTYGDASKRLFKAIRSVKPDAFIEMNAMEGDGFASAFWRAVDYSVLFPEIDMVCDEANKYDGLSSNGSILSCIRAKKWANSFGCMHNAGTKIRQQAINFSDDAAFFSCDKKFWDLYKNYQIKSVSNAQVAVLREKNSLRYNRIDPLMDTLCIEEFLIQNQIPFDLISNEHVNSLDERIKVLVIAGMEIVSDDMAEKIMKWVELGGRLFLMGKVGIYDEDYLLRTEKVEEIKTFEDFDKAEGFLNAFAKMFGKSDPYLKKGKYLRAPYGQGLFVLIQELDIDRVPRDPDMWMISKDQIMVPRNEMQLQFSYNYLIGTFSKILVECEQKVYIHDKVIPSSGQRIIHIVNYSYPDQLANVRIQLPTQSFTPSENGKECFQISLDDKADGYAKKSINVLQEKNCLLIEVSGIKNHTSLVLS